MAHRRYIAADSFWRVSGEGVLPVCALLRFFRCSFDIGGRLKPLAPLPSEAFWLWVIIFTLPTAYGPRSLWRAMWYWLAPLPRASKWPEFFQISSHSSKVSSNAMPRRLAAALCTTYRSRGDIRERGIVNTFHVRGSSGRAAVRRCTAALYHSAALIGGKHYDIA